ncbi:hypothetical protein BV25DRAFT_1818972 [Artomyces pyxidatus]|uniref:Uncharacterized protein n=1 Tax=Artomyces pyxidatus TaxID=48021 RepID=A0ACB8TGL0_9AGAM|nr:hypothetical protein BV25DRAFT_1818972 [Artomyces pyxidatus]
MKQKILSDSSSSDGEDDIHQLTINEHFAKAYEYRKEREELAKLKEKYGDDTTLDPSDGELESDSESDESEDEDGEELTPAVDAAILRTLARIKQKDPGIYEVERNVFHEEQQKSGKLSAPVRKPKEKAAKPLTLPAHRLATVLDSSASPDDEDEDAPAVTHAEEQERLRVETIAAFHASAETGNEKTEEEDAEGDLFTLRDKTQDELALEEEEYRRYLEREVGQLDGLIEVETEGVEGEVKREEGDSIVKEKKKKGKKGKSKAKDEIKETDQEFLMNYILNRGWIDRSSRRVPTYDEVTSKVPGEPAARQEDEPATAKVEGHAKDLLDDDEFDEVAERFESSYNFRFEEPDAPHIPSFPRAVDTVRRPSEHTERRKEARERRKQRKEEELHVRREEVKRLKGLKLREIQQRLEKVEKEGGWSNSKALEGLDLDGDWDAEAYDKQMAAILEEAEGNVDDEKPVWDDDIDVNDIVPPSDDKELQASGSKSVKELKKEKKREKKKAKAKLANGEDGVDVDAMDAEVDRMDEDEEQWDGTEEMRKRVLDKYMDELYELEFNDVVAGMPTRFRYAQVPKNTYALTPAEILLADDKDLNEYMGIKKYAPYRKEKEQWDAKRGQRLRDFKQKMAARGVKTEGLSQRNGDGEGKEKKRKGKKERMREKAAGTSADAVEEEEVAVPSRPAKRDRTTNVVIEDEQDEEPEGPAKKKRRRHKKSGKSEQAVGET